MNKTYSQSLVSAYATPPTISSNSSSTQSGISSELISANSEISIFNDDV